MFWVAEVEADGRDVEAGRGGVADMELVPGIHLVDGVTSNVYVIVEGDELAIVDTGLPGSGPKILEYVRKLGHGPERVRRILLTHQHPDHVGGAAALAAATGAEVVAHPLDAPAIAGKAAWQLPRNVLVAGMLRLFFLPRVRTVAVTRTVEDGETLPVFQGDGGLRVVATPGHTRGHVAFYAPGRRLLFAGDAYVHQGERVAPPPRMVTMDMEEAKRSMVRLAALELDASLPGHGTPMTTGSGARLRDAVKGW